MTIGRILSFLEQDGQEYTLLGKIRFVIDRPSSLLSYRRSAR